MDDMQRDARVAQESPTTTDDSRETTAAAIIPARLLANPRRVRRA
jgi:hypothetical protein